MEDLSSLKEMNKLKLKTLCILAKYMKIPNYRKLKKAELTEKIIKEIISETHSPLYNGGYHDLIGGYVEDDDTCIYPCPDSPTGEHEFEVRGRGYGSDGELLFLEECRHCLCKRWV